MRYNRKRISEARTRRSRSSLTEKQVIRKIARIIREAEEIDLESLASNLTISDFIDGSSIIAGYYEDSEYDPEDDGVNHRFSQKEIRKEVEKVITKFAKEEGVERISRDDLVRASKPFIEEIIEELEDADMINCL